VLGAVLVTATVFAGATSGLVAGPAAANTPAYELYCPNTPVGAIVMNGTRTTGSISPSAPSAGTPFTVTDYQDRVILPSALVSAAAALGTKAMRGTASAKVEATGATPLSIPTGTLHFDVPIPSPVPPAGLAVAFPATPGHVGPFTSSGGTVRVTAGTSTKITIVVAGSPLDLVCSSYRNDALPSGITTGKPSGSPIAPVIATTGAPSTTLTAHPSTGLADGQTITAAGSGFTPGASVALVECQTGSVAESGCDLSTVHFVTTTAHGAFSAPYVVARLITAGGVRIDCATRHACILGAGNVADPSQGATTPLAFNPKIHPLPPLKLSGTLDATGTVVPRTGVATVSGTITCNRPVTAGLEGQLSQIYRRFIFRSDASGQIACVASKPQAWTLTFQPQTGLFATGAATAQVFLTGSIEGTTSEVTLSGTVRLKKT